MRFCIHPSFQPPPINVIHVVGLCRGLSGRDLCPGRSRPPQRSIQGGEAVLPDHLSILTYSTHLNLKGMQGYQSCTVLTYIVLPDLNSTSPSLILPGLPSLPQDEFSFYLEDTGSKLLLLPAEGNAAAEQVEVAHLRCVWASSRAEIW